jgi:hypothetical protein
MLYGDRLSPTEHSALPIVTSVYYLMYAYVHFYAGLDLLQTVYNGAL